MTSEETSPPVSVCSCTGAGGLAIGTEARIRNLIRMSAESSINGMNRTRIDVGYRSAMRKVEAILDAQ